MAREGFGTDPTGILARGAPRASGGFGGFGINIGGGRATPDWSGGPMVRFKKSFAKGGSAKKMAKGGSTASKRADGCAKKGKTKGRMV